MGEKHGPAPPWNETRGCVAGRHAAATNLGFGYGQVHAAVTLGLAGQGDVEEAEQRIAASVYDLPVRDDATGLLHFARDQLRRSIYSASHRFANGSGLTWQGRLLALPIGWLGIGLLGC
jgi:hypothetical protein